MTTQVPADLPATAPGPDGVIRCPWAAVNPLDLAYHDAEWGVPIHGESAFFERMALEGFQSGLSWITILKKRPAFRTAFAEFDVDTVAGFDEADVARLLDDAGIVRHRGKIAATITNAGAIVALRSQGGLEPLLRSFTPRRAVSYSETVSPESTALSKELKKRGFSFVGPTTMHAMMQAVGFFDPHHPDCHRRGSHHADDGAHEA